MRVIVTLNFKGGVGKTTVTWLLGRYLYERKGQHILVMDADPQMSLTTAVQLTDSGFWDERFRSWHDNAKKNGTTLCQIVRSYISAHAINQAIDNAYVYQQRQNFELVPSDEELYWFELEAPPAQQMRDFVPSFLAARDSTPGMPSLNYCLIDCPPAFNSLSFSAVCQADLVLIPINPDVFAAMGVRIMLNGLKQRLPKLPKFVIFMNRARIRKDAKSGDYKLTKECQRFLDDVSFVTGALEKEGVPVRVLRDLHIPERAGIKRALGARRLPPDLETYFAELWESIEKV